ncbi:hypothetical protein MMC30_002146 [Trapelia coarctata]|nr:hypothetical protein [Trapelia coarctata]
MTRYSCSVPDWLIICIALPLTPIWLPALCLKKGFRCVKKKVDTPEKQEIRRRNATRPPQLPYSRKFNLSTATIPPSCSTTSPLLRLPYSVRRQIYEYLFDNRYIIHITNPKPRRIKHTQCLYPPNWHRNQHIRTSARNHKPLTFRYHQTDHLDIEILRTCRTIYQEAHPLVYSTNTFQFDHLEHLIYFNQTVRPQHLAMIRYLQVDWDMPFVPGTSPHGFRRPYNYETWMRFWNIVATRLVGLKALDLVVRVWLWDVAQEHKWLEDVAKIRGLKEFVLAIKYPEVGTDDEADVSEETKAFRREVERKVKVGKNKQKWKPRSFDEAAEEGKGVVRRGRGRGRPMARFENEMGDQG